MLFGYFCIDSNIGRETELALLPDKITNDTKPLPISKLKITNNALIFLGAEECVKVGVNDQGGTIISAVKPARMFMTANRPEKPGFAVNKICIQTNQNGQLAVYYDREKGWEEFTPNEKDY